MTPQELKTLCPKFTTQQWAFVHGKLLAELQEPSLVKLISDHMRASANGEHAIPIYGQATTPMGKRQYSKLRMLGMIRFFPGTTPGYDKIGVCWGRLMVLLEGIGAGSPILGDGYGMRTTAPLKAKPAPKPAKVVKKRIPWPCKKEAIKV